MATYTKIMLSESTNGVAIPITASGSPGTLVHTAVTGTSDIDEVWMYAQNKTAAAITLSAEWGESKVTITGDVPAQSGLTLVAPGLPLNNSLTVRVYAASGIFIHGFVNRIV
jgi:hypothetical protein